MAIKPSSLRTILSQIRITNGLVDPGIAGACRHATGDMLQGGSAHGANFGSPQQMAVMASFGAAIGSAAGSGIFRRPPATEPNPPVRGPKQHAQAQTAKAVARETNEAKATWDLRVAKSKLEDYEIRGGKKDAPAHRALKAGVEEAQENLLKEQEKARYVDNLNRAAESQGSPIEEHLEHRVLADNIANIRAMEAEVARLREVKEDYWRQANNPGRGGLH